MVIPTLCAAPRCVALALDGSTLCAVHVSLTSRQLGDVPIRCRACGRPIRIGQRWIVRAEGAFHNTTACLNASRETHVNATHRPRPVRMTASA